MKIIDYKRRTIRFTSERISHLQDAHPEMLNQESIIEESLLSPDCVVKSKTDSDVELYYKHYVTTPVGSKFLCVVVKYSRKSNVNNDDNFIITAYFTDAIKRGELLWKKK